MRESTEADLREEAAENLTHLIRALKTAKSPESRALVPGLELAERNVGHADLSILSEVMDGLRESLAEMTIEYYGDGISVADLLSIKDKSANEKAFAAIEQEPSEEDIARISYLPERIARKLSEADWPKGMDFYGLRKVTPAAAEHLIKKEGRLYFFHLDALGLPLAQVLGKHKGQLFLLGIDKITDEEAQALATQEGTLAVPHLTEMSTGVARAFARRPGELILSRACKKVAPGALKMFGDHQGFLNLGEVEEISDEEIDALAQHQDGLMVGVKNISAGNRIKLEEICKKTWSKV